MTQNIYPSMNADDFLFIIEIQYYHKQHTEIKSENNATKIVILNITLSLVQHTITYIINVAFHTIVSFPKCLNMNDNESHVKNDQFL